MDKFTRDNLSFMGCQSFPKETYKLTLHTKLLLKTIPLDTTPILQWGKCPFNNWECFIYHPVVTKCNGMKSYYKSPPPTFLLKFERVRKLILESTGETCPLVPPWWCSFPSYLEIWEFSRLELTFHVKLYRHRCLDFAEYFLQFSREGPRHRLWNSLTVVEN